MKRCLVTIIALQVLLFLLPTWSAAQEPQPVGPITPTPAPWEPPPTPPRPQATTPLAPEGQSEPDENPLPELRSGGEGAWPASHSLPAPVWELGSSFGKDQEEKSPITQESSVIAAGWQTITYEGFEGAFPTGGWAVYDTSNDGYERYWNDTSHLAYHEVWSAWPATGGADRLDPETDLYPNNMDTWMIYGPFDLSDASDAQTVFYLWRAIEPTYDGVFFGVSADGTDFYGYSWDGTVDWELEDINFRNIENEWGISFLGDSTVWAGWYFHSPLCHNM